MTRSDKIRSTFCNEVQGTFEALFRSVKQMQTTDDAMNTFDTRQCANVMNGIDQTQRLKAQYTIIKLAYATNYRKFLVE